MNVFGKLGGRQTDLRSKFPQQPVSPRNSTRINTKTKFFRIEFDIFKCIGKLLFTYTFEIRQGSPIKNRVWKNTLPVQIPPQGKIHPFSMYQRIFTESSPRPKAGVYSHTDKIFLKYIYI